MELRAAVRNEYAAIREIIARAFKADEADLWDYLVAHDPALQPEGVRVALADGRPVAVTVVLPRQIRTAVDTWVSGAVITLVACDPDFQGKGYGGATVRDALAYGASRGMAVATLYGHPGYYPRFGFAPVLPGMNTTVSTKRLTPEPTLAPAEPGDLPAFLALWDQTFGRYPCAVRRDASAWMWAQRMPHTSRLLTLPDRSGYAYIRFDKELLEVFEAVATDAESGRRLLSGLAAEAAERGLGKIGLFAPPDSLLCRLALAAGGEQKYSAAGAGMAAVLDFAPLLPPAYAVESDGLYRNGRQVLSAPRAALVQLALGYRTPADLLLMPACSLAGGASLESLGQDFPQAFPKWTMELFWYGE